jgi:hypothetical protein
MKYLTHVTFHLLYLGVSLTFLSGMTLAVETSQPQVQFADNHLTVKVKDISLVWLLQEIARQSGLTLEYNGSLDERVTIRFHNLPIDDGLRRILRQQNFALEYVQERQEKNQSTVLRASKLWVFLKGEKGEKPFSDHPGVVTQAVKPILGIGKGYLRGARLSPDFLNASRAEQLDMIRLRR